MSCGQRLMKKKSRGKGPRKRDFSDDGQSNRERKQEGGSALMHVNPSDLRIDRREEVPLRRYISDLRRGKMWLTRLREYSTARTNL